MNSRVFAFCVIAFGWIPIYLGWVHHVSNGQIPSTQWMPVVMVQALVLCAGAAGGFLAGWLVSNIKASTASPLGVVGAMGPAAGMGISMGSVFSAVHWLHAQFPSTTYGYMNGFA